MADHLLVDVFYCRKDLPHVVSSSSLRETFLLYNLLEKLTTRGKLHHYVHVAMVNVSLVELYDVWMIHVSENLQFLLQLINILFNIRSQDAFDGVFNFRFCYPVSHSHRTKVATTKRRPVELVDLPDVIGTELHGQILEFLFTR